MFLFVTFLAIISTVSAVNYREEFLNYMRAHGKTYSNSEFSTRFNNFKANLNFVNSWDAELKGFSVGINEFSDMTNAEFVSIYNGFKGTGAVQQGELHVSVGAIPSSINWATKGAVTGIKNQGQCGSCWSFSTTGNLEGAWQISGHTLTGLSEKNLMDCSTAEGNEGCNGGLMDNAFKYVISNKGIDSEASYPYVPQDGTCKYKAANDVMYITGYKDIASGNEADLTNAIATVGPISVAIDASLPSFQSYTSGIYYEPSCSSTALDHGVLAVGYGQTGSGADDQYYIVKNSWGTSWGQQGYIWMARNRNNNCGIATMASYSTGPTAPSK